MYKQAVANKPATRSW